MERGNIFFFMYPIPWRFRGVEEVIAGKRLDGEPIRRAREAAVKAAQPLKRKGYKIPLLKIASAKGPVLSVIFR